MRIVMLSLLLLLPTLVRAQITLQAYRDSVYQRSTRIDYAASELDCSLSELGRAKTGFLPSLSAAGTFTTDLRHTSAGERWSFSLQPRVEQTIYAGGAVRATYRRAQAQAESSSEALRQTWLEVRYAADVAYWTLSAMQLYVAATEEYVDIISSLYDVVDERYREGYVAKSDVLQVEARLSEARYALVDIRNDYDVAQHRFYNLLGEEQTTHDEVALGNSILDSMAMPVRVGAEELLLRRPDVARSGLAVGIAEQGVTIAKSAFNPRLTASIGSSWQTYSPNVGGRTYLDGALVVGVNVPIFHWRERRYAATSAEAGVRKAEADLSQARRDATLEEADGWSDLTSSYSQIRSSLHNLAIASENLSISTFSYREGQATVLDVLQAQISWIQIYTNAITARFNYAVALSEYMRLTAQQ